MTPNPDNPFDSASLIYRYTRHQALADGVLIDLTDWAKETGFTIPVACTAAVWNQYITPPEGTAELGQSKRGRAHDLLWMLYMAIRRQPSAADRLHCDVIFLNRDQQSETVTLHAQCGPGDDSEPVLTVMLPHED